MFSGNCAENMFTVVFWGADYEAKLRFCLRSSDIRFEFSTLETPGSILITFGKIKKKFRDTYSPGLPNNNAI